MTVFKLQYPDNVIFEADEKVTKCSGAIQKMLQNCNLAVEDVVTLPNITSGVLSKVLEWAEHRKHDEERGVFSHDLTPWDVNFFKIQKNILIDLISAGNNLEIRGLMHQACKTAANMIKGKSTHAMRQIFNIEDDFSQPKFD